MRPLQGIYTSSTLTLPYCVTRYSQQLLTLAELWPRHCYFPKQLENPVCFGIHLAKSKSESASGNVGGAGGEMDRAGETMLDVAMDEAVDVAVAVSVAVSVAKASPSPSSSSSMESQVFVW